MLMRSLSRGRGRDVVQRFSLAAESLAPIVALVLMVPAALGLGAIGFLAGFWAGQPAGETMLTIVQFVLLGACAFTFFAPLVFPASSEAAGQLRLLLLPIPRGTLYAVQTLGVLADPWLGVLLPLFVGAPIGLAAAGRPLAAIVVLVAGILMMAVIVGLAMLSASVLQLLLRNRQRGERVVVGAMFAIMLLSLLPPFILPELEERHSSRPVDRRVQVERGTGEDRRVGRVVARLARAAPPGQYVAAASAASTRWRSRPARCTRSRGASTGD
jgi:hypothetical protein